MGNPIAITTESIKNIIILFELCLGFNIFKDSIRGSKEKELAKEKENNFLRNLDNILLDDEESKIDKPLLYFQNIFYE